METVTVTEITPAALDAARALIQAYPVLVDAADAAGVTALFAEDGSLQTATTSFDGREAILDFYATRLGGSKLHLVTDIRVTGVAAREQGEIAGRSRFVALVGTSERPQLTWGTYEDRIVVDGGTARFQVRRITM